MLIKSKLFTKINIAVSVVLGLLGFLILLFNILGLWVAWHLAGFSFYLFIYVSLISSILSLMFSFKEKKLFINNLIITIISIFIVLFTIKVSARWFW